MTEPQWRPAYQQADVEIKKADLIYSGFNQIYTYELRHRCFSGGWSPWVVREQIQRRGAVAVILYDPIQDSVVLVEQFRVGLLKERSAQSPWMLEVVAGLQEDGETAQETVYREAQEEAGCEISKLIKIGEFYNTPGAFTERTAIFCGICQAPLTGSVRGAPNEHEDIKVHVFTRAALMTDLESGAILMSASTMIAWQWLLLHQDLSNI